MGTKDTVRRPGAVPKETGAAKHDDDACRCKETAQMTPRQLLTLMMEDLAFWKKKPK